jgi:putative ABC transport system permease protein
MSNRPTPSRAKVRGARAGTAGTSGLRPAAVTSASTSGSLRFFFTYLRRELRRRKRQALLAATGLAVGIALVVTVIAASTGFSDAESSVLHSLYGVGTDMTVSTAALPVKLSSGGSSSKFGLSPGSAVQHEDLLELLPGLGVLDASSVSSVSRLHDVAAAAGGLTLQDTKLTVPSRSQLGPNGQPPASALSPVTFTADGVDLGHLGLGPFGSASIASGRTFAPGDARSDVAVVNSRYAAANKLTVGSAITIAHTAFKVIGLAGQPQGGGSADVYIPLGRAQALAASPSVSSFAGKVSTIYVAAASASDIPAVQAEIAKLLPSATVTSSSNLGSDVSGSLASASSLATNLGRWLAIAVLIAAFAVASLLSLAAVARRVREIGTLKALGWRTRRIIAQLMGESIVVGVVGAVMGIVLGVAGAGLVDALAPKLSATVAENPGSAPAQNTTVNGTGTHHSLAAGATHTIPVHLHAPITITTIVFAVALALGGAAIAGGLGAWRAARLRPATALANVG